MRSLAWATLFAVILGTWVTWELVSADEPGPAAAPEAPAATATPTAGGGDQVDHSGHGEAPEQPVASPTQGTEAPNPAPAEGDAGGGVHEHGATAGAPSAATPGGDEARLQGLLDEDARRYASALLSGDAATVRELTAGRCSAEDPAQVVVARRAAIEAQTGVSLAELTAGTPLTVHSDVEAGEAHAFLGLFAGGARALTSTPDGWLLENGHWRNAEC